MNLALFFVILAIAIIGSGCQQECGEISDSAECLERQECVYKLNRITATFGKCLDRYYFKGTCAEITDKEECLLADHARDGNCEYKNNQCVSLRRVAGVPGGGPGGSTTGRTQLNNVIAAQPNPVQVQLNPPLANIPIMHDDLVANNHGFALDGRHRIEVSINNGTVVNAEDFIKEARILKENHFGWHFTPVEKVALKNKIAKRIIDHNLVNRFYALNPSYDQAWRFLRQNGGYKGADTIELMKLIKAGIKHKSLTGLQYAEFMGQVFDGAYADNNYLEANSEAILLSAGDFIGLGQVDPAQRFMKSYRDLEHIKEFLTNVVILNVPSLGIGDAERQAILLALDQHMLDKKDYQKAQVLPRLRTAVHAEFENKKAALNLNGKTGYYLVRAPDGWGGQHLKHVHQEYDCPVCFDDGLREGFQLNNGPIYCKNCLKEHIHQEVSTRSFPIKSPALGHDHELPINQALALEALNNNPNNVREWERGTLIRYAQALGMSYVECRHPGCQNVIFESEKDAQGHITCAACETHFCFNCQKTSNQMKSHVGQVCGAPAREVYFGPEVSDTRPCPYCPQWIQMPGGCNHMTCKPEIGGCGAKFHWVYGKFRADMTVEERHWAGVDQGDNPNNAIVPQRSYRVPGDPDFMPGKECAFPDNGKPVLTQEQARHAH